MRKQDRLLITGITLSLLVVIGLFSWALIHDHQQPTAKVAVVHQVNKKQDKTAQHHSQKIQTAKKAAAKVTRAQQKLLWKKPTGGKYPTLNTSHTLKLTVSLDKQRVYLDDLTSQERLYTMICSSGLNQTTPQGTYAIQERGDHFYNSALNEGANYWVSWLHHGVYLFHSIPTDVKGNYEAAEGEKLGQPASHGCIRLSIPDAKWLYDKIPQGTTVVVGA
ncbi:hypothetical protein FC15_GL001769 [Lapidilactobacillus concavus DSM 17758]|jgi:lipoprotein-anchoring transpeptidase ErfK/SrfK|uniref:L,D-TPase catalytic domain-containing protein n=1 Tax=Lapidilactobacillus concavus DSM 17758 TaxID=1423735 RepID=A0A0R1VUM4_9LACO|nr:L,D-transpeptidase [Lapidilactobacillus concavus]KRM09119.1 hypothetical protein FC15_GL001769 [Lapidilactobacillus concavus DSM 17758]GEL13745.1 hypothetical protein LCO01nite_12940 [Lapidilactobacillus concavus]